MNNDCLIGHSGFVGKNIASKKKFKFEYNSKNIEKIKNKEFDLVVCSGLYAEKWKINNNASDDYSNILKLSKLLKTIECKKFVLISTIDVYAIKENVNEDTKKFEFKEPYGANRYIFEQLCLEKFRNHCFIIRLPGLFGNSLKKNVLFDLLNNKNLNLINKASIYQYYNLDYILNDINKVIKNKLKIVNLISEPINNKLLLKEFFPKINIKKNNSKSVNYNIHSKHGKFWSTNNNYIYSKNSIFNDLKNYIKYYQKEYE
jgi:hypothetical protein